MDGTREYYANRNKSLRERQMPCDFTHRWNSRNKTNEQRGKRERETNQETNLTIENKLMATRGEECGGDR